jgi:hypothetical protein
MQYFKILAFMHNIRKKQIQSLKNKYRISNNPVLEWEREEKVKNPEAVFLLKIRFMPVIQATQEAEIRRTAVQSQLRQIVRETLSWKKPFTKRAGGVAQGVGPEFKPHYHKKKSHMELTYILAAPLLGI